MRVLYVDDDRVNALLFSEACRFASGVVVETADSGEEALEIAAQWRPDFLVIDLHLPDMLG
jgi:CheY-like chemotaxis protein